MALHSVMAPRAERHRHLESVSPRLPGLRLRPRVQTPNLAWSPVLTIALSLEVVELGAGCLQAMLALDAACLRAHTPLTPERAGAKTKQL